MTRALVLGGGGPIGIAWESGLIAGLARAGVDLGAAEHIIGTSAGSFVGALLALGHGGEALTAPYARSAASDTAQPQLTYATVEDFTYLTQKMSEAFSGERDGKDVRLELGAWALRAKTVSESTFIASFGRFLRALPADAWPERPYACTAVDTETGELAVWDRAAGVGVARAVASSCAVPGVFPAITIRGRRYMDGGMRSMTNADLARGHERVLVVAMVAGPLDAPLARRYLAPLEREVALLRDSGSKVAVVTPDAACIEAFGPNLLDNRRSAAAAAAGLAQAAVEADRLRSFWNGA